MKGLRTSEEDGGADDDEGVTISLGVFLATIGIFGDVGDMFGDLYQKLLSINKLLDPLHDLTVLFNLTTELGALKSVNRQRRVMTKKLRAEVMHKPEPSVELGLVRTDLIPIKVMEMCFRYHDPSDDVEEADGWLFRNVNLSVDQGSMVALVGAHGTGKATFLRLLGQRIFPTEGSIYVPSHLRVLFVSQDPVIMSTHDPMWNLTYGLGPDAARDVDKEHIKAVLKELKMSATLKLLEAGEMVRSRGTGCPGAAGRSTSRDSRTMVLSRERPQSGGAKYIQLAEAEGSEEQDIEDEGDEAKNVVCCRWGQVHEEHGERTFEGNWHEKLTYTEKVKMSLARGFIMNPEILILHRPLKHIDFHSAHSLLDAVVTHTRNRGLGLSMRGWINRRPRTVIYVPESSDQTARADVVWQIDGQSRTVKVADSKDKRLSLAFQRTATASGS